MADSWIGGDLTGLQSMGRTMGKAPGDLEGVTRALSSGVEGLVSATGWSGEAAERFDKVWTADALTSGVFSSTVGGVASTISTLGDDLTGLDRELHQAAEVAHAAGLELDEHGYVKPFTYVTEPGAGTPAKMTAYQAYQVQSEGIRAAAQQVRTQAQSRLAGLLDELLAEPPKATSDLYVTAADYLRGLLAVPDEARRGFLIDFDGKLARLRQAQRDARSEMEARRAAGEQIKPGDPAYEPFRKAINDVKGFEQDAAAARRTPAPAWAEALNYKLGDFRAMSALEEAGKLPKFLEFAKDVPVIDVAATGLVAGLQARDDVEKGWSVQHAVLVDGGTAAAGLAAGAGAAALMTGAAPVALVAVGAGAVAFGVGDIGYQAFHEHWSEDIHDHGVVVGIADGTGHTFHRVGDDVVHIGSDAGNAIGHGAKKLWHGLFG